MLKLASAAIIAAGIASTAQAATIAPGTASIGFTTGFTVSPSVFSASNAFVTVSNTTGGLTTAPSAPFPFAFGTFNGSLSFTQVVGDTILQSLPSLLSFGGITFSAGSVTTLSYSSTPGVSTSGSLYLLGVISQAGFDDTGASLTLSFNSTGGSAYSASATLATPPSALPGGVPEPATWAMMLAGFGAAGYALRRRRTVAVSFS
jgi:hypothetical protein